MRNTLRIPWYAKNSDAWHAQHLRPIFGKNKQTFFPAIKTIPSLHLYELVSQIHFSVGWNLHLGGFPLKKPPKIHQHFPELDESKIKNCSNRQPTKCSACNIHFVSPFFCFLPNIKKPHPKISDVHRIGWWENLQETPIFDGKNHGFL